MVKLEGFLTAYKDTLISCTWKAEKAVVQAQAIITGILESHIELNWSLAILAHQGQGPDQDQVGPVLEALQSLDVSEPTGPVEVAHSSLLKITIPPQFNLKIMKRPLPYNITCTSLRTCSYSSLPGSDNQFKLHSNLAAQL